MDYVPAYHYELQTFAEKRETNWVCGPHKVTCTSLVTLTASLISGSGHGQRHQRPGASTLGG